MHIPFLHDHQLAGAEKRGCEIFSKLEDDETNLLMMIKKRAIAFNLKLNRSGKINTFELP
jgi:hypothetical protein